MKRSKLLSDLFFTFFKIGLFTFGGGYAMIALIEDSCVNKRQYITHDEMMNITVIAESTPGPIAINCATFVGYKQAKTLGAVIATLGIVLPSFLILFAISLFLDDVLHVQAVASAFIGIRAAVSLLILQAGINMLKKMKKTPLSVAVVSVAILLMLAIDLLSLRISSIVLLLAAALVSLALTFRRGTKRDAA